jgi:release factor glutamine methyltransferase
MIYEPAEDSFLLEREVKKLCKEKVVLDIGAGSGLIGKSALKAKAKEVTFSDKNIECIKKLKNEGFMAIQSDLFKNIKGKFDLISFNPPYLPADKLEDNESKEITTGGLRGDEILIEFFKGVGKHLEKNGKILFLVSSLTPMNRIDKIILKKGFKKKVVSTQNLFMEKLFVIKAYR